MSGRRAGQSMTSTSCWSKKAAMSRAVWVHGSIHHDQLIPAPMVDCTQTMTDGQRFPSLGWTQASISPSPCLRRTRTRPSLWLWGEPGLITEDTVSPLSEVPHCVSPPPLTAALPVLQNEPRTSDWTPRPTSGGQKPSPNGSNWHPPPKSADHLRIRRRGAEMKRSVLTTRSSWRSSRGMEIFILPPRFLWYGRPVSQLRRQILLMHPWDTPCILATSCWEVPFAYNLTSRCNVCSGKCCGMIPFNSSKKYQ